MEDTKKQWHPAFTAALMLELKKSWGSLVFEKEHNLNTKPLEIDLLVIKKDAAAMVENEIGELFRGHNIIEYKSPKDHLDIATLYKTEAYAGLYKAYGKTVDAIKADDITVSLIREAKPEGLFRHFKEHGAAVSNPHNGIYYITEGVLFPTQVIVTRELEGELHTWLKPLSGNASEEDMRRLFRETSILEGKSDRELADSVLEVSVKANKQLVEKLRGDDDMSQALLEIMEPVLLEREKQIEIRVKKECIKEGIREGIRGLVDVLRDLGHDDNEIKSAIMKQYHLTEDETSEYL